MKDYEHEAFVNDLSLTLRELDNPSLQGDEMMLGLLRTRIEHHESALDIPVMVAMAEQALSRTTRVVDLPAPVAFPETIAA